MIDPQARVASRHQVEPPGGAYEVCFLHERNSSPVAIPLDMCPRPCDPPRYVGEGSFGMVFQTVTPDGKSVAVKRVVLEGSCPYSRRIMLRELVMMKHFSSHPSFITFIDAYRVGLGLGEIYTVHTKENTSLHRAINWLKKKQSPIGAEHLCRMAHELLEAVKALHSADVIHRDIKPSNILVTVDLHLRLCDFGKARELEQMRCNQKHVLTADTTTRLYAAPELLAYGLLRETERVPYGFGVDVWACGCVLAEIATQEKLFAGSYSVASRIGDILGVPAPNERRSSYAIIFSDCDHEWEPVEPLRTVLQRRRWRGDFVLPGPAACPLLERLLILDPVERPTAAEALQHPWFEGKAEVQWDASHPPQLESLDDDGVDRMLCELCPSVEVE